MTKKDIKSAINKAVYEFAETLGYQMSDDGEGACVTFWNPDDNSETSYDNTIEYHRSEHYCCTLNWASQQSKDDADKIDEYVTTLRHQYNVSHNY